jgi:hypothetical protein
MSLTSAQQAIAFMVGTSTGLLSLWVALHKNRADNRVDRDRQHSQHTEAIFGGYSKIVDDLRNEVDRLNAVIENLRIEQEECERRNDEMAARVEELLQRVSQLEGRDGR